MRIRKSIQTKVCIDGSLMKEYMRNEPLTECFLKFLEKFGAVRFLEQLRKSYFLFEKEQFISIKGFFRDNNVEGGYKKESQDPGSDYFHLLLYYYDKSKRGISTLKGQEDIVRKKRSASIPNQEMVLLLG